MPNPVALGTIAEFNHVKHGWTSDQRYVPYRSNDPFTPSIAQNIRNQRMASRVGGMDDVGLPARTRHDYHRNQGRTQQEVSNGVGPVSPIVIPSPRTSSPTRPSLFRSRHRLHRSFPLGETQPVQTQIPQHSIPVQGLEAPAPQRMAEAVNVQRPRSPIPLRQPSSRSPEYAPPSRSPEYARPSRSPSRIDRASSYESPKRIVASQRSPSVDESNDEQQGPQRPLPSSTRDRSPRPQSRFEPSRSSDNEEVDIATFTAYYYMHHYQPSGAELVDISPAEPTGYARLSNPNSKHPTLFSSSSFELVSRPPTPVIPANVGPLGVPGVHFQTPPAYSVPAHPDGLENAEIGKYIESMFTTRVYVTTFVGTTLPQQLYLHLLLRFPALYFSRVDRIFKATNLTMEEIKEMAILATSEELQIPRISVQLYMGPDSGSEPVKLSPAYQRLKDKWESFIDNLMREWNTFNLISVLLLSAIMTVFQIQGAAEDLVTRYLAFWSLLCALMSLLYGCLFIIRFGTMRKASVAAEWALEAQRSHTILWNVWVMLAMPVVWLAWSIVTFVACIMTFMWRVQTNLPSDFVFATSSATEFAFRVFICCQCVLGIGTLYGALIVNTFRHYGTTMDEMWQHRVEIHLGSASEQHPAQTYLPTGNASPPPELTSPVLPRLSPPEVPTPVRYSGTGSYPQLPVTASAAGDIPTRRAWPPGYPSPTSQKSGKPDFT